MIGRALRSHAHSFTGDIVLLWVAVASFAVSLSLATSVPPELAEAPADARAALAAPFAAVVATYSAVLASVYGSFRYTLDRRDGVVAQRLMLQPRWAILVVRAPASAVGGAVVALAGSVGGHAASTFTMGGMALDAATVGGTVALGAVAGLWGLGIGMVVQAHLVALFAASMSMGAALMVAMFWKAGAVYLPLLAMLEALRFDVTAVGIMPGEGLDGSAAVLVTVGWVMAALLAGGFSFMNRDVR